MKLFVFPVAWLCFTARYTEYSMISVLTGGDQESEAPSSVFVTLIEVGARGKPGTVVLYAE